MSNRAPDIRRVTLSLLGSLLLHLLGVWLAHLLITPAVEQRLFRVRVPSHLSSLPERFKPRPAIPISRELLERLQAETAPLAADIDLPERLPSALDTLTGIIDHPLSLKVRVTPDPDLPESPSNRICRTCSTSTPLPTA